MSETTSDYSYDLTHDDLPEAGGLTLPSQPVRVATQTDDDGQDLSYDLAHDVPR